MKTMAAPGVLIAVDKPKGISSHDAVAAVKRALGPYKVGHAGTLDPLASGVLIVGVAQATRLLGALSAHTKSYEVQIVLGKETSTDDDEGETIRSAPVPGELLQRERAAAEVSRLPGSFLQRPPAYSAVSVGGQRAYKLARKGLSPELKPREVQVFSAELLSVFPDKQIWELRLTVSAGTYVRSLARDLGQNLGCGAHVGELRRISCGSVGIERCLSFKTIAELGLEGLYGQGLDPFLCLKLPVYHLDEQEMRAVRCGAPFCFEPCRMDYVDAACADAGGDSCALEKDGILWGIWRKDKAYLRCVQSYPCGIRGTSG